MAKIDNPMVVVQQSGGGGDIDSSWALGGLTIGNCILPESLSLNLINLLERDSNINGLLKRDYVPTATLKHLYINFNPNTKVSGYSVFQAQTELEDVTFVNGVKLGNCPYMINGAFKLKHFYGDIDLSDATDASSTFAYGSNVLETVTIKANTIKVTISFSNIRTLSDDSIISIANGLNEPVTGKTLTLHPTPKAKCSTIIGSVSLDETSTFHIFTEDSSGTTTLEEFITVTKGWTLA